MADTTALLNGLQEYRSRLDRHLRELRYEFDTLMRVLHALNTVYEGAAAEEFKAGWAHTASRFEEYINRTTAIAYTLDERITFLREADKPEHLLRG